jgi:ribosome-associated translation inhibitor RaiA
MSWKTIGINVGTLGIAWLVKRYRQKVPKAVLDALELSRLIPPERLPPEVRATLQHLEQLRVELELAKLLAAVEKAEKSMRTNLEKNEERLRRLAEETPVTLPGRRSP